MLRPLSRERRRDPQIPRLRADSGRIFAAWAARQPVSSRAAALAAVAVTSVLVFDFRPAFLTESRVVIFHRPVWKGNKHVAQRRWPELLPLPGVYTFRVFVTSAICSLQIIEQEKDRESPQQSEFFPFGRLPLLLSSNFKAQAAATWKLLLLQVTTFLAKIDAL